MNETRIRPLAGHWRSNGWASAALAVAVLSACSTAPPRSVITDEPVVQRPDVDGAPSAAAIKLDPAAVPDAVPRHEPRSRYGNPPHYEVYGVRYEPLDSADNFRERGIASWYGTKFHGRRTSSGEPYDMFAMTAAHKTLPLPSYVRVRNLDNGRTIVVRVNDRGPFHPGRIIDLSYTAAAKLGILETGTGRVEIETIVPPGPQPLPQVAGGSAPSPVHIAAGAAGGTPGANVFLQVGAFSERGNAERLRERLHAVSPDVHIAETGPQEQQVFRVRFGPFSDPGAAQALADSVSQQGLEVYFVTE